MNKISFRPCTGDAVRETHVKSRNAAENGEIDCGELLKDGEVIAHVVGSGGKTIVFRREEKIFLG